MPEKPRDDAFSSLSEFSRVIMRQGEERAVKQRELRRHVLAHWTEEVNALEKKAKEFYGWVSGLNSESHNREAVLEHLGEDLAEIYARFNRLVDAVRGRKE